MCCNCRYNCTVLALILGAIAGVAAAFLLITGSLTVTPLFLAVAFAVAVVYLGVLVATASRVAAGCQCRTLGVLLAGILGTVASAVILLLAGIVATSVISAILVGVLAFFFVLMVVGAACYVRCLADCED